MKRFLLPLLLLIPLAAHAFDSTHPRYLICQRYAVRPPQGDTPPDHSKDGYHYADDCAKGNTWSKVEKSDQAKNFLKVMVQTVHQDPALSTPQVFLMPVYSCYRDQTAQNFILCLNECDSPIPDVVPSFGKVQCSGRIAASLSEHTLGTAEDFKVPTTMPPTDLPPNATPQQKSQWHAREDQEIQKYCGILNGVRQKAAGGRGGITIYGVSKGLAYGHYDVKPDWCNWGGCEKFMGEGHCKRTKYRLYEAKLMKQLADAQLAKDQAAVTRLQAELAKLRADCPPGDLKCRDNFKDPSAS